MAPSYKLIYFNARGKAEHIRFIFAHAGVDYIDERIPKEKWPVFKSSKSRFNSNQIKIISVWQNTNFQVVATDKAVYY